VVLTLAARPDRRRTALLVGTILLAIGAYWATRGPLGELEARAFSIVVIAAAFWATEALPLFATAFVVVGLQIVFLAGDGGLADQLTALLGWLGLDVDPAAAQSPMHAGTFLAPLASDIIILFLGGFLLAAAVGKHGVDEAIARRVLQPFTASPRRLILAVLGITALFSMWMSNTAAAAMMIAVVGPLVRRVPDGDRFRLALLLAVPFGANVGGIGTPIGTPPNAIAYGVLNQAGYDVTFLRWMLVAIPLELMLLGAIGLVLLALFPPDGPLDLGHLARERSSLSVQGRRSLVVLGLTIGLWVTSGYHGIQPGAVALLAAAGLTAFGVLGKEDVDSIDWNILILMWGALTLSVAAEHSGLMRHVARVDLAALPGGPWSAAAVVSLAAAGLSTIMSNTATAALLVPAALALSVPGHEQLAMLAALACSFAMAMPVSTPPNAIAYATGEIPLATMLRTGSLISLVAVMVMLLGYRIVLPLVF
jgi:solute carrier family 13 (sodium-dependent dicarboxylate transporter), member 2/3/5